MLMCLKDVLCFSDEMGSIKASIPTLTSEDESNKSKYVIIYKGNSDTNLTEILSDGNYILRRGWYKYLNATCDFSTININSIKCVLFGGVTWVMMIIITSYQLYLAHGIVETVDIEIYETPNRKCCAYNDSKVLFCDVNSYVKDICFSGSKINLIY